MSWVTLVWSMIASACLTLALVHALVWWRRREAQSHGLFALAAVGTAGFALSELWMMQAGTPSEYGRALKWGHLPVWLLIVSLTGFIRLYLHAGRRWLAWTVVALRTASLLLDLVFTPNINYREITGLRPITFLGETVSAADGVPNPWMLVGNLSLLLFVVFVADATRTAWRRGNRRHAVGVGGSILLFGLAGTVQAVLVFWGLLHWPMTASPVFLGIIIAMGFELSQDLLRAAHLSTELKESESRMKLAAAATGLAVWRWDMVQDSIWVTSDGRALYGVGPEEVLSLDRFMETVHPEDRDGVRHLISVSTEGDGNFQAEYRIVLPGGTLRWISARGRVEFNEGGRPLQMLGVSIDNTLSKEAELEAERNRRELAHLARVITLGELSGSLAHELNQPLAIILSNAQAAHRLLAQSPPDLVEVGEILTDIVSEDRRASEVIQRLRALLQRGETLLKLLDVNEVIDEVIRLTRAELNARGVQVTRALGQDLPRILGDRIQLQQVLLNLILNACEAMAGCPAGGRRIHLASAFDENTVCLSVADNGCGLPADSMRIFEPFFTTKSTGLGMGLAICRSIAKGHGGRLWVTPNPNQGVTFHLALPRGEGDKPPAVAPR